MGEALRLSFIKDTGFAPRRRVGPSEERAIELPSAEGDFETSEGMIKTHVDWRTDSGYIGRVILEGEALRGTVSGKGHRGEVKQVSLAPWRKGDLPTGRVSLSKRETLAVEVYDSDLLASAEEQRVNALRKDDEAWHAFVINQDRLSQERGDY